MFYFFSETTFPREVSYFSRRDQTAKSSCLKNMVGVQEFPISNMAVVVTWAHTSSCNTVTACKNMATYITAMDAGYVPGLQIILCVDFVFLWDFMAEYDIMKFVYHKRHNLNVTWFLLNFFRWAYTK
jgi:hypothetical protein